MKLVELKDIFSSCCVSLQDVERYCSADLDMSLKLSLQDMFCQAFTLAFGKLEKYTSKEGQPGVHFLKSLPFFNPKSLIHVDSDDLCLPGLETVPDIEIKRYVKCLAERAVKMSGALPIDLTVFWNSVSSDVPNLAALARRYIYTLA